MRLAELLFVPPCYRIHDRFWNSCAFSFFTLTLHTAAVAQATWQSTVAYADFPLMKRA